MIEGVSSNDTVVTSQPGPQTKFLSADEDLVVYGGAAGGGKTYGMLLDSMRHCLDGSYRGVFFRRTYPEIMGGGGVWDTAFPIYDGSGGRMSAGGPHCTWPGGAKVEFKHLQHEKDKHKYQGLQYQWVGFDEGTHFTKTMITYLLTRVRSPTGLPTKTRISCNPDADSWLTELLEWFIDQDTGYPIAERSGKTRWVYIDDNDKFCVFPTKKAAQTAFPDKAADGARPLSFTFIPSTLADNVILTKNDPNYRSMLMNQPLLERERLLKGNWKITAANGLYKREWFEILAPHDVPVKECVRAMRRWDLAATESDEDDPDWSVGLKGCWHAPSKTLYVLDCRRARMSPKQLLHAMAVAAADDGPMVQQVFEEEPGASGKIASDLFLGEMRKLKVPCTVDRPDRRTGDKVARSQPAIWAAECGRIKIVKGRWNDAFINELVRFPYGVHDDQADSLARLYSLLSGVEPYGMKMIG